MRPKGTVRDLLAHGASQLNVNQAARLEAEVLLSHTLDKDRAWLFAHATDEVVDSQREQYLELIGRRQAGEPIAYLTGYKEFWSLNLRVSPSVLIPRPETELLVETALGLLVSKAQARLIDLGTGSGAIALALASERPAWRIDATDNSRQALNVAKTNAEELNIKNVRFRHASWFGDLAGPYDAVLSNPPYVAAEDPHLDQGDCRFEPRQALTPEGNGMAAIETICQQTASGRLNPGGLLLVEHGYEQGNAVREVFESNGFRDVRTLPDLAGRDRVTRGHYS